MHGGWWVVGGGFGWFGLAMPRGRPLAVASDKSHIFADQINLIDITQNDGRKVFTFVFAATTKNANK